MKSVFSYQQYLTENIKDANALIAKKMQAYERLKEFMQANIGWIGTFTEWLFSGVSVEELETTYNNLVELKRNNKSIDIRGLKYEKCIDKIAETQNNLSITRFINEFPSQQKRIAQEKLEDWENLLLKCSNKPNKTAFLSKISRYKTLADLNNALKIFSKDSDNNKESILEWVSKTPTTTVMYNTDKYTVINLTDIGDVQKLGSDTSWCILSKYNWDNYTKNRHQFILYNWSLEEWDNDFKIGFTLTNNGTIHAAHNILDHGAIDKLKIILEEIKVKTIDLIPEVKKIKVDPVQLKSTMSYEVFSVNIENCEKKDLPLILGLLLKKVPASLLSEPALKCFAKLVKRLFEDYEIITVADVKKIGGDALLKIMLNNSYLQKCIKNSEDKFIVSFGSLPFSDTADGAIRKKIEGTKNISDIGPFNLMDKEYEIYGHVSKETVDLLYSRWLEWTTKADYKNLTGWEKSGIVEFYIFSHIVNKPVDIKTLHLSVEQLLKWNSKLKVIMKYIPQELIKGNVNISYMHDLDDVEIDYLKKEDCTIYLDSTINFVKMRERYSKLPELIEHFKDYKITFKISKQNIGVVRPLIPESLSEFKAALTKLGTSRKGTSISDKNWSVVLY